jgi:hypothetical protein
MNHVDINRILPRTIIIDYDALAKFSAAHAYLYIKHIEIHEGTYLNSLFGMDASTYALWKSVK